MIAPAKCDHVFGLCSDKSDTTVQCKVCHRRWIKSAPNPRPCDAEEVSEAIHRQLSPEQILQLAREGHLPHTQCLDGPIMFVKDEAKSYILDNYVERRDADPIPRVVKVAVPKAGVSEVPDQLASMADKLRRYEFIDVPSCVYFLCLAGVVVYVGQSVNLPGRLGTHITEGQKRFDSVFYLVVPSAELERVESAFIAALRPQYNMTKQRDTEARRAIVGAYLAESDAQ